MGHYYHAVGHMLVMMHWGVPGHHFTNTLSRYMWGAPFELLGGHPHVAWCSSVKLLEYPYAAWCPVAANLMIFTLSWTS